MVRQFLRKGGSDVVIPQLALRSHVGGPALVEALRREQVAGAKKIAERQPPPEADSAAEIARAGLPGAPEKGRYAQLMARLQERQGAQQTRNSASTRLGEILRSDGRSERRDFIAAALRAALALHAPGADKVAAGFAQDPDPEIAAAARGEPEAGKAREAAPLDPRTALWSDQGARIMLAHADPERRVRIACARKDH